MARLTGDKHVASLGVFAGAITDHLAFLDYIVRDKVAHGEHIRSVLLLLDTDIFGTAAWTNRNLDSFLPPKVSGESKLRGSKAFKLVVTVIGTLAAAWFVRARKAKAPWWQSLPPR